MSSLFPELFDYQLIAPFILRIVLAVIFIGHGYSKLFKDFKATARFFNSIKIRPGKFWARFLGFVEMAIAVLLFLGFLTQLAAIIIIATMMGAIVKVKKKEGFLTGWSYDLLILVCAIALLFLGPGIFSIDLPL